MDGWGTKRREGGRKGREGKEVLLTKVGIVRTVEVDVVCEEEIEVIRKV